MPRPATAAPVVTNTALINRPVTSGLFIIAVPRVRIILASCTCPLRTIDSRSAPHRRRAHARRRSATRSIGAAAYAARVSHPHGAALRVSARTDMR
jgi:hypothetical protein